MSHAIYSTDAIILKRAESGEADITYWLLTKDLGLIVARAQSVRKDKAKMRGYLQLFSYCMVSLVRGKYIWRITGAQHPSVNISTLDIETLQAERLNAFARVATFVCRMTVSDTLATLELVDNILSTRVEMQTCDDVNELELTSIANILITLGYLDSDIMYQFNVKRVTQNQLAAAVNNAISESHL